MVKKTHGLKIEDKNKIWDWTIFLSQEMKKIRESGSEVRDRNEDLVSVFFLENIILLANLLVS